jgi:hypothetical protein
VLLALATGAPLAAQASCSVPNPGNRQTRTCTVTLTGTLRLAAQVEVRLGSATTDIAGGAPATHAVFAAASDTGLVVLGPSLSVSASGPVSITLVNAPQFTGPVAKPASDVRLGVGGTLGQCAGVPVSPLSVSALAVQQASPRLLLQTTGPVTSLARQLCLRVRWSYANDGPGSYQLPLTISVTAP